jgi:hypothetical protein
MKRVFKGGAVVALMAILVAPAVYADDPRGPFDPPQSRISIPGGIAAQAEPPTVVELFWAWLQVRIGPPGG